MDKNAINALRVSSKLKELFTEHIDLSDLPSVDESALLSRSLAALGLMIKCGLDCQTSSSYITDGYHDMGIDAVFLDRSQKQLFVVQSKWRAKGRGAISAEEMQTFVEGLTRIFDCDLNGANKRLQNQYADVEYALSTMGYKIHAIFIHTGDQTAPNYSKRSIESLLNRVNDEKNILLEFDEIFLDDVFSYLADGKDSDNITLDDVIITNWGKVETPYTAYYGTVSAMTVGKWFADYGNRLFAKNIRFYKGSTEVNEGIINVLSTEPENFFYYNNGIKVLCQKINRKAKEATTTNTGLFTLQSVSLVNGVQTTGSIGSVYMKNPEKLKNASVMIEIIDLSGATEAESSQITKLSNTQNRIENRDFVTLDPNQERIKKELSFSHFDYLYKSGEKIEDPSSQISYEEAIVALACHSSDLSHTVTAKSNVGALSENIKKPPYSILFNKGTNSFCLLNSVLLVRIIDNYIQKIKKNYNGRDKLIIIHGNRFIAHYVLQNLDAIKIQNIFDKEVIDAEKIRTDIVQLINSLIIQMIQLINQKYADSYPANIFKNVTKCKEIIELLPINLLIDNKS